MMLCWILILIASFHIRNDCFGLCPMQRYSFLCVSLVLAVPHGPPWPLADHAALRVDLFQPARRPGETKQMGLIVIIFGTPVSPGFGRGPRSGEAASRFPTVSHNRRTLSAAASGCAAPLNAPGRGAWACTGVPTGRMILCQMALSRPPDSSSAPGP